MHHGNNTQRPKPRPRGGLIIDHGKGKKPKEGGGKKKGKSPFFCLFFFEHRGKEKGGGALRPPFLFRVDARPNNSRVKSWV